MPNKPFKLEGQTQPISVVAGYCNWFRYGTVKVISVEFHRDCAMSSWLNCPRPRPSRRTSTGRFHVLDFKRPASGVCDNENMFDHVADNCRTKIINRLRKIGISA